MGERMKGRLMESRDYVLVSLSNSFFRRGNLWSSSSCKHRPRHGKFILGSDCCGNLASLRVISAQAELPAWK